MSQTPELEWIAIQESIAEEKAKAYQEYINSNHTSYSHKVKLLAEKLPWFRRDYGINSRTRDNLKKLK